MTEFTYTITDEMGLHARPAGLLVKEAKGFADSTVTLHVGGASADLKRLFAVMGLGVKQGDEVRITVEGGDEAAATAALEAFMKANV